MIGRILNMNKYFFRSGCPQETPRAFFMMISPSHLVPECPSILLCLLKYYTLYCDVVPIPRTWIVRYHAGPTKHRTKPKPEKPRCMYIAKQITVYKTTISMRLGS